MPFRRARLASWVLSAAVLAMAPAALAQAASGTGWRVAFSHHYGAQATESTYLAVTAPGKGVAWAAGGVGGNGRPATGRPAVARWRNGRWRAVSLPSGLSGWLGAISADSAKDAWAVSLQTGFALHWNGTKWSVTRRWPEPKHGLLRELTGVTALSPSNVWVFGGPGAFPGVGTWHFNGHSWAHVTSAPGNGIVQASALSAKNIWAIGSATAPEDSIAHFTGRWHTAHAAALTGLQFTSIAAVSSNDVWAVGTLQANAHQPRLVHMTRGRWSRMALPWPVDPTGLAPDGKGGLWITALGATDVSLAIHRSASGTWSRTTIGQNAAMLRVALIPGTTSLWGAGSVKSTSGVSAAMFAHGRVG
jgi:hypothetical protein